MRKAFTKKEILKITEIERFKTINEEDIHLLQLREALNMTHESICKRTEYLPFVSDHIAQSTVFYQIVFSRFLIKCMDLILKYPDPIKEFCDIVHRIGEMNRNLIIANDQCEFEVNLKVGLLQMISTLPSIDAYNSDILLGDNIGVFCHEDIIFIINEVDAAISSFIIKEPKVRSGRRKNEK